MYSRGAATQLHRALLDTPVVLVNGPRQCGKTTLVRDLIGTKRTYVTLDDDTHLAAARRDPLGFLREFAKGRTARLSIDEVQRAPELLRSVKRIVDGDRMPGRFLLTGSADLLTLPTVADSLAGRMEVVTLLPLSRVEIQRGRPQFVQRAFGGKIAHPTTPVVGDDLVETVLAGGYPEMLKRSGSRRRTWAREYLRAIVARDVRDIANVTHLEEIPRLLRALAEYSGQLLNSTALGGQLGLDAKTVNRYAGILQQLFLVQSVEPWHTNRLSRIVKSARVHFLDSGLLAATRGLTVDVVRSDRQVFGPLLETFVFAELSKQIGWMDHSIRVLHYRDRDQYEVDFVLERDDGAVVGIEVKASATVTGADFRGLERLARASGARWKQGIVLYDSDAVVPFGARQFAVPVSCLW